MRALLGSILTMLVVAVPVARAGTPGHVLSRPQAVGDQVVFYYDARPGFTTFLTVQNTSARTLTVDVRFYRPTHETEFGNGFEPPRSKTVTLTAGALTIVDVGELRDQGLAAQPGIAFATAVNEKREPITSGALTGSFTVANLATGSAFGAPGAARSASSVTDMVIDGDPAVLKLIRPTSALLAGYYDPASLAPVADGGSQLVFLSFEDRYDPFWWAQVGKTTWDVSTTRGDGTALADTTFTVVGVRIADLASVGGPGVNGAAGSMRFHAPAENVDLSRLIYFTQSLGTFGTGYLLPPELED